MEPRKIKCYNCGGDVIIGEDSHIGICSCCMAEIPIPEESFSAVEAYSTANELLSQSRFEEAREIFKNILIESPLEAAACWGIAVSEYGIEYVQDPATGELLPTLHRLSLENFSDYLYVKKAIEYAPDYDTKQFYINSSRLIDRIQSQSLQISQKEEPYDIFICYKQTEENEKRTADSRMAADIYRELTRRGYKTFFAEQTLHVGEEYEPRIFAALQSARVMVAIASKAEYYTTVWVQNEWSRYADLIRRETEAGDCKRLLIPMFQNTTREELPEALRSMPKYVDMGNLVNPRQELLTLVAEHFGQAQSDDVSDLRRQVRGQSGAIRMEESAENYRTRGTIFLVNGEFDQANEMFQKSLALEKNGETYLGLMMCELKVPGKESLHSYDQDIRGNELYRQALDCADPSLRAEYETIAENCLKNRDWSEVCAKKKEECEAEIKKLSESAKSGDLCPEAKKKCQDIRAKAGAVSAAKRRMTGNWTWRLIRVWLIFANLIPSIALVILDFIKKADRKASFLETGYTVAYVCIGLLTIVLWFMILGQFDFFRDGIIRFILRLVAVYFIVGLNSMLAYSRSNHLYYFAGCLVVNVLFYLVKGRQISADLKLVGNNIDNICPESVFDELKEKFEKGADEALAKKTQEYRQYYRTDDEWETSWNRWKESVGRENMVLLNKTREDVNYAER